METSNICSRPKRLRKDCSPTKLLAKNIPVDQSPCAVEASALSDDKTEKGSLNSPGAARRNLAHKKWTLAEKIVFFEGLRENGRCFDKIAKLFEQKSKNKPEINNRDTGQCRYFFTRSIKRIISFPQIKLECGIRKRYMEVLALVNYGEILRKTHRELNKRSAENLNEMIHKGFSVLKLPGRMVRLKTPMCPVVKRFTKNRDVYSFVQLPQSVTFEFTPQNAHELNLLRDSKIENPFIRLTVPITKSFKSVLKFVEDRTKYRAYQNFRQVAEQCRPLVTEPTLMCRLHPLLLTTVSSVEETDKVYTPPSFNGAEQMLAQGIGLEQGSAAATSISSTTYANAITANAGSCSASSNTQSVKEVTTEIVASGSVELESKLENKEGSSEAQHNRIQSPQDRTNFNVVEALTPAIQKSEAENSTPPVLSNKNILLSCKQEQSSSLNSQPVNTTSRSSSLNGQQTSPIKSSTVIQRGPDLFRPQIIYVVPAKNTSSKQYIRSSSGADDFIGMLKSGFSTDSISEDLNVARLHVMLNVCPIIQLEYFLDLDIPNQAQNASDVGSELQTIVNIGMQISKSKRSQTPVMNGSSKSPNQQPQSLSLVQSNGTNEQTTQSGSGSINPVPGSVEEKQLKDHIMMLQSSGKVRLRNRLRHGQDIANSQNFPNLESSFRPVTAQQQTVIARTAVPKLAPKLFNQISGSISMNSNGQMDKITFGNHSNGQRTTLVGSNGNNGQFMNAFPAVQTQNPASLRPIDVTNKVDFIELNQPQPGMQQPFMERQQVLASSDDNSIKDIVEIALKCADVSVGGTIKASNNDTSMDMQPLMCSTQICPNDANTNGKHKSVNTGNVNIINATCGFLPPVHEILATPSSSHQRQQTASLTVVPQVRFLPGHSNHLTDLHHFDTASNDSFLSKQLDGEIAEMMNENSIDVVNKLDAFLDAGSSNISEASIFRE